MKILSKAGAAILLTAGLAALQGCASSGTRFDGRLESLEEFRVDYECRVGPGEGLSTAKLPGEAVKDSSDRKSKRVVVYSASLVRLKIALARQIFGPWNVKAVAVRTAKVQEILERLSGHPSVSILVAPKITCFDGATASLLVSNEKSYVKNFKIEVAEEAMIGDPHIGVVRDGLLLTVKPKITESGKRVHSTITLDIVAVEDVPALDITLPFGHRVTIQTPVVLSQKLRTNFELNDGGTAAISGFFSKDRDSFLALFLTANIVDADKIETPGLESGRFDGLEQGGSFAGRFAFSSRW